jgi:hypothetical protein
MLIHKNNFSARDGRFLAFQWAEATFPMGGNKNFANRKKIKRPSPSPGSLKTLAGIKTFSYLCGRKIQLRAAAANERQVMNSGPEGNHNTTSKLSTTNQPNSSKG